MVPSVRRIEERFRARRKDESESSDVELTRRHRRRRRSCSSSEERKPKRSRQVSDPDSSNGQDDERDPLEDIIAAREARDEGRYSRSPTRHRQRSRSPENSEIRQDDRYRRNVRDPIDNCRRNANRRDDFSSRNADVRQASISNDRNNRSSRYQSTHDRYRDSYRNEYDNRESLESPNKRYHERSRGTFNNSEANSTRTKKELEDMHGRLREGASADEARLKREISAGVSILQKQKPDFDVSGVLAEETNMKNGVMVSFDVPLEARKPTKKWKLFVFKSTTDKTEPIRIDFRSGI
eukprot:Protomagalhaensia_wolfi_Nauph_80__1201@NODE_1709_length_1387_cov_8_683234_g1326_i0_p1_GENE_NODE_1709_length_1387_cov_8_683234_g1326_i0NODE_1709_length_1387_cov_8_683234_g1326_i0_p1_ORF_typecomplete_len295_score16_38_NODE_1709_length_1387_cov_8_683234_g1326_i04561340